jgi:hypothetical protein
MPILRSLEPGSRAALIAALLLAAAVAACGGGGDAGQGAAYGGDLEDGDTPARIEVEPCALLTNEEISEQLFLSLSADEQARWTSREFDLATTEPDLGVTRMCEYKFQSRYAVGGGPTWHSDFDIMVFPSNAIALAEDKRRPIAGAGPEMFKEPGTAAAYYVVKGNLAVSLHRFPGRKEEGEVDAGRLALLQRIAARLP